MKYFSILEPWLEPKYGMIAQPPAPVSNGDAGDTCQREGMLAWAAIRLYKTGKMDRNEYEFLVHRYIAVLNLLNDPKHPGLLRRFGNSDVWVSESDRLSRDQSIPNIIAMGDLAPEHLKKFFFAHLKRGLLFLTNSRRNGHTKENHGEPYKANTKPLSLFDKFILKFRIPMIPIQEGYRNYNWKLPDTTLLGVWAMYIRAFRCKWLYPLLYLFDLDILINALLKVYYYDENPKNNDDVNFIVVRQHAELVMTTFWVKLAKKIYARRDYPEITTTEVPPGNNVDQKCMNAYFRERNPGPKLEWVYFDVNEYFW